MLQGFRKIISRGRGNHREQAKNYYRGLVPWKLIRCIRKKKASCRFKKCGKKNTASCLRISLHKRHENVIKPIVETAYKKLTILLAEDMLLNQRLVSKFMEKWSYEIDIANNGKEALEKLKNKNYDLILMDIQMPEMDGHEATQIIRSNIDPIKRNIPIIALTAEASQAEAEKCNNIGMNGYLPKPFNAETLHSLIIQLTHHNVK